VVDEFKAYARVLQGCLCAEGFSLKARA